MGRWTRVAVAASLALTLGGWVTPVLAAAPDAAGTFQQLTAPRVTGILRWDHTLTGYYGSVRPVPTRVRFQWFRDGHMLASGTGQRYRLTSDDFGRRIHLVVVVSRTGYLTERYSSALTAPIDHRVPVSRTFTYSLGFRGRIVADTKEFAARAAETYAHPRGWRSAGFAFRRVASGGDFTLYLAAADTVPSFGYPCSTLWSCRVGRNVIVNQTRWLHATRSWNAAGLPLRDYRHLVVDHETGHWLGHRHAGCSATGALAPVMMQQSKDLDGCRFNPFPLPGERWTTR